jgi:imidazolonepropionase-like amidohydrolase
LSHRFPALIAAPPASPEPLWLTHAQLITAAPRSAAAPGSTGASSPAPGAATSPASVTCRENAAVLVEDGIIVRIGDAADPCPPHARPVDLGGRVLMPGLTDAHTHASGELPKTAKGVEQLLPGTAAHFLQAELRDYLRYGVTTIRVCGSQGAMPQEARQAMRYGAFRGPRLLTCGKIISATAPGGRFYGDMYREADGPDDMRRAVREQLRAGADFIKVMTTGARSNELEDPEPLQLTEAELSAVVDEAHRVGYRVCAHAEGLDGCEAAIRLGIDTIEHGMYLNQRPDLLAEMAANGQVLVPTLSGYYWMAGLGEVIDPAEAKPDPDMPPVLAELAVRNLAEGAATMRAARDLGVRIALGSDMSLAAGLEYQRMVFHGLTPGQALTAATVTAAEALGLGGQLGTIAEGQLADLVALDASPLTDPAVLTDPSRIHLVLQCGTPVAGQHVYR